MGIEITRRYELDMGHRVPGHEGKCRRVHGHRYVVLATVTGAVQGDGLEAEAGMVLDFGHLKEAMAATLEQFDHQLVLWDGDPLATMLIDRVDPSMCHPIRIPVVPTAERLAEFWGVMIQERLPDPEAIRVTRVEVRETPNCVAFWTP